MQVAPERRPESESKMNWKTGVRMKISVVKILEKVGKLGECALHKIVDVPPDNTGKANFPLNAFFWIFPNLITGFVYLENQLED